MKRISLQSFKASFAFPEKQFCICPVNFEFLSFLRTFNSTEDLIYNFCRLQNKFIGTPMYGESFWEFSTSASLSRKNCFVFVQQIFHFCKFYQHSVARLLVYFRTSLKETPTQRKNIRKMLKPASLSLKRGFVFVEQILHY